MDSLHFHTENLASDEVAAALVAWHDANQRALPWRMAQAGQRDGYSVWVAEMMLQQTRVSVVEDYFRRWMARFPTLASLAEADLDIVLKQWEGLGYYARARNLHKAARIVVEKYGGVLPADAAALQSLPGIGRYSSGAILSLAYNQPAPLLDGNVKRVLARLLDLPLPVDQPAGERILWGVAEALVQAAPLDATGSGRYGALNEAIMELGALICTPQSPRCLHCPVQTHCQALAHGTVAERPLRTPRKSTPHYDVAAGVIWQGAPFASLLLIAQRPADGLLGGLWEFPGGKWEAQDGEIASETDSETGSKPNLHATLQREIREELAIEIEVGDEVTQVKHAFTHFRITLHAFHARWVGGDVQTRGVADYKWIAFEEVGGFAMGKADRVVVEKLEHAR